KVVAGRHKRFELSADRDVVAEVSPVAGPTEVDTRAAFAGHGPILRRAVADSATAAKCRPFASAQGDKERFVRAGQMPSGHWGLAFQSTIAPPLLPKMGTSEAASTF